MQLHERSWSSTSARGVLCANCYVQTAMCKLVVQTVRCKLVGVEACDRVWGDVEWVVAGCGGMWQGFGYVNSTSAHGVL